VGFLGQLFAGADTAQTGSSEASSPPNLMDRARQRRTRVRIGAVGTTLGTSLDGEVLTVTSASDEVLGVRSNVGDPKTVREIPAATFHEEPGPATPHEDRGPSPLRLEENWAQLWGPDGPVPEDVHQAFLGDCAFAASMRALCAANQSYIRSAFPQGTDGAASENVKVRLFRRTFLAAEPVTFDLDRRFYTRDHNDEYTAGRFLWPAFLTKAFAELTGGSYDGITHGSTAQDCLEALTGQRATNQYTNPFAAPAAAGVGLESRIAARWAELSDGPLATTAEWLSRATGVLAVGSMIMISGDADAQRPGAILQLLHSCELANRPTVCGTRQVDDDGLNVFGNHSYHFTKVEGDRIYLRNPLGESDPVPLTEADFRRLFDTISTLSGVYDPKTRR
jgi:hypothetical protein